MPNATHYSVPQEPGRWRALALAAAVHAALFAFLWIGIRWQSETPVTLEAEVWSPQAKEAAPLPTAPLPEARQLPKPVLKEPLKPVAAEPPIAKPDIALEQKKKLKELKAREDQEKQQEKLKKALEKQHLDDTKKAEALAKKTQSVQNIEQKRKQDAIDAKLIAKMREDEMRRINAGTSGTGGSGDASKTQGGHADAGYVQRLSAKIKSQTVFAVPLDLQGNPAVEYAVELFPDGSVRTIKLLRSSQLPGFDEAVKRAIQDAAPYPSDKSGIVPSSFTFTHQPKDK